MHALRNADLEIELRIDRCECKPYVSRAQLSASSNQRAGAKRQGPVAWNEWQVARDLRHDDSLGTAPAWDSGMRTYLVLLCGILGCGTPTPDGMPDSGTTLPSYGTISVGIATGFESGTINGVTTSGQPHNLSASLFPNPALAASTACIGATVTEGACCYVPAPPPTFTDGGLAGQSADGGPNFVMLNIGPIALTDLTSNAPLGSIDWMPLVQGFGYAEGYPFLDFGPSGWNVGDTLQIAVGSGPLGAAFTAQASALAPPQPAAPSSISLAQNVTVGWTADPNAQTMTVALQASSGNANHGTVSCTVPDASARATITPTLLAAFASGDSVSGVLTRTSSRAIPVQGGAVTFASTAANGFMSSVQ